MKIKKLLISAVLLSVIPMSAYALVLGGGSNLGLFGYPSHSCTKPFEPMKPIFLEDQFSVDLYNSEVEQYNYELEAYVSCLQDYISNANNDIKRIQEKILEATNFTSY